MNGIFFMTKRNKNTKEKGGDSMLDWLEGLAEWISHWVGY